MRLARINFQSAVTPAFVADDQQVYSLSSFTDSIDELVTLHPDELAELERRIVTAVASGDLKAIVPDRWLPPIGKPGKIIGVAMNNSAFAKPSFRYFTKPAFFMKSPSSLIGHGEPIIMREEYGLTHPEPELACIIGRRASHLDVATARDAVFGYTIINDITSVGLKDEDSLHLEFTASNPGQVPAPWRRARDEHDWDVFLTYHFRSKCTDGFGPIGPWITTADAVSDPDSLGVRAWLGDRQIAEDSTANLSFPIAEVLAHLTRYAALEPGDIVHFGTAIDPRRYALREANILRDPSDIRIEIDGLGTLSNPVRVVA